MNKKQLQERINELEREHLFKNAIIEKLLRNYIMIKPKPKGQVKDRIIVFEGDVVFDRTKIRCESLIFLEKLRLEGENELIFTHKLYDEIKYANSLRSKT